jgi:hypothetical protein
MLQNILQYITKDRDRHLHIQYITEIEKNLGECIPVHYPRHTD